MSKRTDEFDLQVKELLDEKARYEADLAEKAVELAVKTVELINSLKTRHEQLAEDIVKTKALLAQRGFEDDSLLAQFIEQRTQLKRIDEIRQVRFLLCLPLAPTKIKILHRISLLRIGRRRQMVRS